MLEIVHRGDGHRRGRPREEAARALDRYELARASEQTFDSLSGGQQARFQILLLELSGATLLLLDEPASALDPSSTQKIEELVYELKQELTIIIVTHNLQQAVRASDHTAFFYSGELVEFGPTEQIFTRPREERTDADIPGGCGRVQNAHPPPHAPRPRRKRLVPLGRTTRCPRSACRRDPGRTSTRSRAST